MSKAKRSALLFLSVTGILTLILVMSLPTLALSPGKSFSLGRTAVTMPGVTEAVPGNEGLIWMLRGLLALTIVFVPIYIISSLLSSKGRQRLIMQLVFFVILFWIADYLVKHPPNGKPEPSGMVAGSDTGEGLADSTTAAIFSANEAPPWLAVVVILATSMLGTGLVVAVVWRFRQRAGRTSTSLHPLAEAAQDTIESLQAGGDFRTAIIQCYYEMNRVIKQERNITRETAMTPREFETYLVSRGLPQNALETLTRLFEQVRYGNIPSRTDNETMAFACLTEIVNTCNAAKIQS